MYARSVSIRLRTNRIAKFTEIIENEVIPVLRKQKGFQDVITLVVPEEAVAISLWDENEDAEAYSRNTYPEMLKALEHVIVGRPQVRIFEVSNSTFHKVGAPVAV